jgi:multiple sugar transport system ATP-binding protein
VRPEHVRFDDAAPFRGEIRAAEYLGTTQIVTVETPAGPLKARLPARAPVQVGETVGMTFLTRALSLFDRESGRAIRLDRTAAPALEEAHG